MENKKSYYAIIPANVRYDKRLKLLSRMLYGEITALCNERGYCWANNRYFADLYEVSITTISTSISQLKEFGYIDVELIYKEGTKEILNRYIKIVKDPIQEILNTSLNFFKDPLKENLKDNNTFNNTKNTTYNNSIITNRNNTGESPLELDSNFINNSNSINTNKNNLTWTKNKNNSNNDNNENYEDEPRKIKNCTLIASKIGENNKLSGADPAEAHKNRTKLQEARVQKSVSQEVYKYKRRKKQLQKVTESFLEKHSMESDRLVSLLDDYVDMFFESFFNISNQTWRMKLDKLFSISSDVSVLETCVSKAIENGWKNFFESKEDWSTSQGKTLDKRHASSLYEDKNAYVDLDHSLARNADGSLMMF